MKVKSTFSARNILIILTIIVALTLYIVVKLIVPNNKVYSFRNSAFSGNMLFYDTLKELGYDVSYDLTPYNNQRYEELIVINVGDNSIDHNHMSKIKDYVINGGKVLFLDRKNRHSENFDFDLFYSHESDGNLVQYDQWIFESGGVLIATDVELLSNLYVKENREEVYEFLMKIHPHMANDGIIFNEYYLYQVNSGYSLWKIIPTALKYVIFELIIVLVIWIFCKGKRFGPPKVYYEESERSESAYTIAVGELFYKAKHYDAILEAFFEDLLNKLRRKHFIYGKIDMETFVNIYKEGSRKNYKKAALVSQFMKNYYEQGPESKKLSKRKVKEVLMNIQYLENQMSKEEK